MKLGNMLRIVVGLIHWAFWCAKVRCFTFQAPASMNINTALRQVALVEGRNLIDLI